MYKPHTRCRSCGFGLPILPSGIKAGTSTDHLLPVFSLGLQPLANDFAGDNEERAGFAPLEVLLCPRCSLAQLSVVVRPDILYRNYAFESFASATMVDHFDKLIRRVGSFKNVVEIGSNNGLFLEYLRAHGTEHVFGIDPALNMVDAARKRGVNTICSLFDSESARIAAASIPKVDLIVARHVFAHVDDWRAFVHALRQLCAKETLVYIEVPYAKWLVDHDQFDTIYHEHLSYVTVKAIRYLLDGTGLRLTDVLSFGLHGGTIGLVIRRQDSGEPMRPSVEQFLATENCSQMAWLEFSTSCKNNIEFLLKQIHELNRAGKRVCGYGASAKSTVWINAMKLDRSFLYGVYDNTPAKLYKQIPGTDIPVLHEGGFYVDNPDAAVLFSWNYSAEILAKQKKWIDGGGKFLLPTQVER